jgi:hypothetical protein
LYQNVSISLYGTPKEKSLLQQNQIGEERAYSLGTIILAI